MKKMTFAIMAGCAIAGFVAPEFAAAQDPVAGVVTGAAGLVNSVATGAGKAVTGVLDDVTGNNSTPAPAPAAAPAPRHHHHHHHHHHH